MCAPFEPAADLPAAERGKLYILIEVTGSGGSHAALYRQLLNAAQTAFYEATGSVSASLGRAVRAAHAALTNANEALSEAGWRAGISCVAYLNNELTIAQAGPALVMVSHPKTIDQYPARPGPAGVALGGPERPEVELYRTTVEPGTMVLMAQSDWLNAVRPESLAAVAAAESPRLAQDYLSQLAGAADLSALLIGFSTPIPAVKDEAYPVVAAAAGLSGRYRGGTCDSLLSARRLQPGPQARCLRRRPSQPQRLQRAPPAAAGAVAAAGLGTDRRGSRCVSGARRA